MEMPGNPVGRPELDPVALAIVEADGVAFKALFDRIGEHGGRIKTAAEKSHCFPFCFHEDNLTTEHLEQQSRNQFYNHRTHRLHRKKYKPRNTLITRKIHKLKKLFNF